MAPSSSTIKIRFLVALYVPSIGVTPDWSDTGGLPAFVPNLRAVGDPWECPGLVGLVNRTALAGGRSWLVLLVNQRHLPCADDSLDLAVDGKFAASAANV
jgi:hypothetical protein